MSAEFGAVTLQAHDTYVSALFAINDSLVASASDDRTIKVRAPSGFLDHCFSRHMLLICTRRGLLRTLLLVTDSDCG